MITLILSTIFASIAVAVASFRKKNTPVASFEEVQASEAPFMLYLRSFQDDGTGRDAIAGIHTVGAAMVKDQAGTYEKDILRGAARKMKVVAVGRPGEELPELGATRLYLENDEWQERVLELMTKAKHIIIRPSNTPGFNWELEQIINSGNLHKTIMHNYIGEIEDKTVRTIRYRNFAERVKSNFGIELPQFNQWRQFTMFDRQNRPYAVKNLRAVFQ